MGVRNGAEFIAGLNAHPKDVWIAGRQVGDVTSDLAFRLPVESLAGLFDQQVQPELRDIMTYQDEESGQPAGLSFLIPRSRDDLVRRRAAMQVWAEATFGLMGRSPDYLNTVLVAFVDAPEFFAQGGRGPPEQNAGTTGLRGKQARRGICARCRNSSARAG